MSYRKAFTLVELLAVVAILAILLLIIVPNFLSSRAGAARNATAANHNIIVSAVAVYWQENLTTPSHPCDLSPFLQRPICEPCNQCSGAVPGMNGNPPGSVYRMFFENVNTDTFLVITAELDGELIAVWRGPV